MNNLTLNVQISGGSQGISVGVTPITGKTNTTTEIKKTPTAPAEPRLKLAPEPAHTTPTG